MTDGVIDPRGVSGILQSSLENAFSLEGCNFEKIDIFRDSAKIKKVPVKKMTVHHFDFICNFS